MTRIDTTFPFSQQSLGDFSECPRRFYLRYVLRQPWPQLESTPDGYDVPAYREFLRKGAALHRWVERHWLGLPEADGAASAELAADPEFALWWRRFLAEDFSALPAQRIPELALMAPLGAHTLTARLDLLAVDEHSGRAVIVDWKTMRGAAAQRPEFLRKRVQTRAYLYALAVAGAPYRGGREGADGCEFHYWMANAPDGRWVRFVYDREAFAQDRLMLEALAADAASRDGEAEFEMTDDHRTCGLCTYATLCRRGQAASPEEFHDEDIDWAPETADIEY
jgi:hypothetical protein